MTTTIGPLTNVPVPGDPIRSNWAQSISTWNNYLRAGLLQLASGGAIYTVAGQSTTSRPWTVGGTLVATTSASGVLSLPLGFNTNGGIQSWSAQSGDSAAWNGYATRGATVNSNSVGIVCYNHDGTARASVSVRVDYQIQGWDN